MDAPQRTTVESAQIWSRGICRGSAQMLAFTMSLCPLLRCPGRAILRERGVFSSLSAAVVKISTQALDVPVSDMTAVTTSSKAEAVVEHKAVQ